MQYTAREINIAHNISFSPERLSTAVIGMEELLTASSDYSCILARKKTDKYAAAKHSINTAP